MLYFLLRNQIVRLFFALVLTAFPPLVSAHPEDELCLPGESFLDPALCEEDEIEVPVQINGKVRGRITLPKDSSEEQALEAARQESDAADVDCKFLGAARMTTLADPGVTRPGAIVMLESSGTIMAYILCSCVRGSNWLCHRGTFDVRGRLDERNPFDERNLVLP